MSYPHKYYAPHHHKPYEMAFLNDVHLYDDIIEVIRRQGFYDCLGSDLVPAKFENYDYPTDRRTEAQKTKQERLQHSWEMEQRDKQIARERLADLFWNLGKS